ncbi:hypothetical protein FB45DRAFT_921689 [Roridomyces roridus]|uniref:BAH domain-containing protein n=1 Tax=Roridomyces roridus TaxID=1738132 RepID=A0AAD7BNA3_9AGAR|nr:hypothetical protein FB45DRAFT_921689 [Roridomyces roridus]
MPVRRRGRGRARQWTHHKSKAAPSTVVPTEDEWEQLDQQGSFIVADKNGRESIFSLQDNATVFRSDSRGNLIYPSPGEPEWIAKIKSIRSRQNGQIWVRVYWYYSPKDVQEYIPSLDTSHYAKNERLYSHHAELIPYFQLHRVVSMVHFLPDDPDQVPIHSHQFFYRHFFDIKSQEFSIRSAYSTECLCKQPYNPTDTDPAYEMHWCPRPNCRRAYHDACLRNGEHYMALDPPPRWRSKVLNPIIHRRLASSADTEDNVIIPCRPSRIPTDLLRLAAQPIVRGGPRGVAGNVAMVVRARRVVLLAIQELDRPKQIDSDDGDSTDSEQSGSESDPSDIRIRSAKHGFDFQLDRWDEEEGGGGFAGWESAIVEGLDVWVSAKCGAVGEEVFVCPECAGAI